LTVVRLAPYVSLASRLMTKMQFGGTVLYVDDVASIVDFYKRAVGLPLRFFDEALGFAELDTGSSVLAVASLSLGDILMPGGYSRPVDGQIAGIEIAFFTGDVAAAFDKAVEEGAVPIQAPRRMPWGLEVAYVRAPEGTMIGFSEPPPRATGGRKAILIEQRSRGSGRARR
jgi:lactoylglutathione lyase